MDEDLALVLAACQHRGHGRRQALPPGIGRRLAVRDGCQVAAKPPSAAIIGGIGPIELQQRFHEGHVQFRDGKIAGAFPDRQLAETRMGGEHFQQLLRVQRGGLRGQGHPGNIGRRPRQKGFGVRELAG